jgi:hypothetical protein
MLFTGFAERYVKSIRKKFDHFATWFPDEKLRLGDVGEVKDGRFYVKTSLERLKIKFDERLGHGGGDWDHSSGSDVSVDLTGKAEVSVPGAPSAAATVRFGATGAFIFQAIGCRTSVIENMGDVGNEIVVAYRIGEYQPSWVVIDRLVTAESATILISESSSAQVDFSGDAPMGGIKSLASASLGIKVAGWKGEVTRYVAEVQLTPMFGASHLHRGILGGASTRTWRSDALPEGAPSGALEALSDGDWLGEPAAR